MEIKEIEKIEPKEVLSWFKKICEIPHGSYHEEQISKWMVEQCKNLGCEVKVYPSGMILAKQKATKGCENWPTVLLQSHLDMVLAKVDGCKKDLVKEPIEPYYDPETGLIKAKGTSLGGDDGIGVATQLAIMANPTIIHGPLEHLFTVNEEDHPGQCIIDDIQNGDLTAKYYINVDGECLHDLVYGGAGCSTMKYNCPVELIPNNTKLNAYNVTLNGFTGGHSGNNITRPHINPIVFLAQCIIDFAELNNYEVPIFKFDGGPINNSLPVYAKVNLLLTEDKFEKFKRFILNQLLLAKKVAQKQEDGAVVLFDKVENPDKTYSWETSKRILLFAALAPNKVFTQSINSQKMYSSSNLGFICIDDGRVNIDFKVRSFVDSEIQRTIRKISSLGKLLGFENFTQEGRLFAFINDITNNYVAQIWSSAYHDLVGGQINFLAVPGGLECATLCAKNPQMTGNTISVNTTLYNCHSPSEGFNVSDTVKFWKLIKVVLSRLKGPK